MVQIDGLSRTVLVLHGRWQHGAAGASLPDIAAEVGDRLANIGAQLATDASALELVCWALQRAEALEQVELNAFSVTVAVITLRPYTGASKT